MDLTTQILWSIPVVIVGGLSWFVADMGFAQRWSLKRAELGSQDKWRELNEHFESGLRCRRPLLRLFQKFVIPGTLEADYALHLSNQGEHERALVLAQKATSKSARRPEIHLAVLPAETMILGRLARYDEAQKTVQRGRQLIASGLLVNSPNRANLEAGMDLQDGMINLTQGRLDEALKFGLRACAAAVSDPARALVSGALTAKGRFKEALEVLVYEPSSFYKYLEQAAHAGFLKSLNENPLDGLAKDRVFAETARLSDEELSSVFGPAVELGKALVFLDSNDTTNLGLALNRTQAKLKSHQIMEHIFVRTRACWHAMNGNVAGVEADLARTRQLASDRPASRSAKYETHLAAGRAYFMLGKNEMAIEELNAASRLALHPMEKHTSLYWLARSNLAANQSLAMSQFKTVVMDAFGTWMEADAVVRGCG